MAAEDVQLENAEMGHNSLVFEVRRDIAVFISDSWVESSDGVNVLLTGVGTEDWGTSAKGWKLFTPIDKTEPLTTLLEVFEGELATSLPEHNLRNFKNIIKNPILFKSFN